MATLVAKPFRLVSLEILCGRCFAVPTQCTWLIEWGHGDSSSETGMPGTNPALSSA
jgi:hypothetical protein